jgi:hypothetical protein
MSASFEIARLPIGHRDVNHQNTALPSPFRAGYLARPGDDIGDDQNERMMRAAKIVLRRVPVSQLRATRLGERVEKGDEGAR